MRRKALVTSAHRRNRRVYHDIVVDPDIHDAWVGDQRLDLRNREYELLSYLVCHPQRALSRRELREEVWGDDFPGGSNVIEVTVLSLRRKLEAHGLHDIIQTVRAVGYMLRWHDELELPP